jgi:drug/metabolite transporter (DMT)-like permease
MYGPAVAEAEIMPDDGVALPLGSNEAHGIDFSVVAFRGGAAFVLVVVLYVALCYSVRVHGRAVQISTCVFVTSLVSTQLLVKELSSQKFGFNFPAWLASAHFLTVWLCCCAYWGWLGDWSKLLPGSIGSSKRYRKFVVPIAASLPLSVIFNNTALVYLGAGLVAIVSTLSPLTTALLSRLMGRTIASKAWLGVLTAFTGAMMIAWGKLGGHFATADVVAGLIFGLGAVVFRSVKVVLQDMLLTPAAYGAAEKKSLVTNGDEEPIGPMHVWSLQCPPAILVSVVYAGCTENVVELWARLSPAVVAMVLLSCASAAALNILGMYTIKSLGGSSMQIVGKLNVIVVVAFSVAFLQETIQGKVMLGTCLVLAGVAIFEYFQHGEKAAPQATVETAEQTV